MIQRSPSRSSLNYLCACPAGAGPFGQQLCCAPHRFMCSHRAALAAAITLHPAAANWEANVISGFGGRAGGCHARADTAGAGQEGRRQHGKMLSPPWLQACSMALTTIALSLPQCPAHIACSMWAACAAGPGLGWPFAGCTTGVIAPASAAAVGPAAAAPPANHNPPWQPLWQLR